MPISTRAVVSASFRSTRIYPTNADLFPVPRGVTGTDAYPGYEIIGSRGLTIQIPEARRIVHSGDDRVLAVTLLPPEDPVTGELTTASMDLEADSILTGLPGAQALLDGMHAPRATDLLGNEPVIWFKTCSQATDVDRLGTTTGAGRWWNRFFLGRALARGPRMEYGTAIESSYSVVANPTRRYPWGQLVDPSIVGYREYTILEIITQYPLRMDVAIWDGADATFTLTRAAVPDGDAYDKVRVFVNGTAYTNTQYTVNAARTEVTFTAGNIPPNGAIVVVVYESDLP